MRIASTAKPNTGISTALSQDLIKELMPFIFSTVAPLVPSIGSLVGSSKRVFQLISRILFHMDTMDRMAGMQHAAARRVAAPKVSLSGAGIT
jgi:histidine ammonia-lyase